MKHKWHKEIKAWADGAEIEARRIDGGDWHDLSQPHWEVNHIEYRIKPQPKVSEFAHIPYWLCCGSLDPYHHHTSCSEAKAGYPERCRFGTVDEHQKRTTKPHPKETQYLYVYGITGDVSAYFYTERQEIEKDIYFIGKIKLEQDDE